MVSTLRIGRSEPDAVSAVEMNGGRRWTYIEELREGRSRLPRNDIFMVLFQRQVGEDDYQSKQLWVYPQSDGNPNFGEAGEWMTEEEKQWCREENARIIAVAKEYPEWKVYLR